MKLHHPIILSIIGVSVFGIFGFLTYSELHAPTIDEEIIVGTPQTEGENDTVVVPADVQAHIDAKRDLISLTSPLPYEYIGNPLAITGEARGYWFFEASFPVTLTDADGVVIAEGIATAKDEWMTEDFVPFVAILTYTKPASVTNGFLILKKDNPSGLPENDNALRIPVRFE